MSHSDLSASNDTLLDAWTRAWTVMSATPNGIFWDADPADLSVDLDLFGPAFDPELPVIDVGCGDGRQTRFLAAHVTTVIGTDLSPSAIDSAQAAANPDNVDYRVLDARLSDQARQLHHELGDANVYIRGVLHAMPPADRPRAVDGLEQLLGARGTLFVMELSPEAATYFESLCAQLEPAMALIRQLNIAPGELAEEDFLSLFPADRFEILRTGTGCIHTRTTLLTGEVVKVSSVHALVRTGTGRPRPEAQTRGTAIVRPGNPAGGCSGGSS